MNGRSGLAALPAVLRDATREAHWELDRHPLLEALARPDLTLAQYGRAMAALYGPHTALEAATLAWLARRPEHFGLRPRRWTPLLERDLADLGLDPPPCTAELPTPSNLDELVGILYALDSSLLGGRYLARHVRQHLGDDVPVRFLEGDPADVRWQAVWQQAVWQQAEPQSGPAGQAAAVAAALAVFRGLRQHLDSVAEAG